MASSTRVLFAGVPLVGAFEWHLTTGVAPYQTIATVHESAWDRILAVLGKPQAILFEPADASQGTPITVSNVYALREIDSSRPFLRSFVLADRRWKWAYPIVVRDCNVPRHTGEKTLIGADSAPVELAASIDTLRYAKYSLDNESKRWHARSLLESILADFAKDDGGYLIDALPIVGQGDRGTISIQSVLLRDGAGAALARAMDAIPGTNVTVELSGLARVFDATDVAYAAEQAKSASAATVAGGIVRTPDRRALRPSKVHVYIPREVELRLDYDETNEYALARGEMRMENVLPVPDPEIVVAGRRVGQGAYVNLRAYLAACSKDAGDSGSQSSPFSLQTIREHWIHGDLAHVWGAGAGDLSTTGSAAARASAVRAHFRQTFRVNPEVAHRLQEMRDVRVAVLDTDTGQRAPAMAWSQYCVMPSMKWRAVNRKDQDKQKIAYNIDDYPGLDVDVGTKMASQARVHVVDAQNGIIRLSYTSSPYDYTESVIPCLTASSDGSTTPPSRNLADALRVPIAFGGRVEGAPYALLAASHKCCVILSAIPAAPNNKRKLHRITIAPSDLDTDLRTKFASGPAEGPEQEVFLSPHQSGVTARFGWAQTSQARQTVHRLLGFNSTDPTKAGVEPGESLPGFAWVNEEECKENAKAVAAEVYTGFVDGVEGDHATRMESSHVVGNVASVAYAVSAKGHTTVRTTYSPARPPIDRTALLPTQVRQLSLRILKAGD